MKILHTVEFYHPFTGGAQEVVRQLSERMAALGHDVTVATTKLPERKNNVINGVKIEEFSISGNAVRGYDGEIERYKQFLIDNEFDVVMNYAAQEWAMDLFFDVIDQVKAKKVMVPCGYSALYDPKYRIYFDNLPDILRKYDASVYLASNYRDINFARENGLENVVIIPNGADEREFSDVSPDARRRFREKYDIKGKLIVTVGNHTGEKGHRKSIISFFVSPFTNATLVIIGKEELHMGCLASCKKWSAFVNFFSFLTRKRVILMHPPREDVVDALKAADLFIFLSNIEASPLVLFEANAAGTPFLSSNAGNSSEIAEWTGGGIIIKSRRGENGRVAPYLFDIIRKLTRLMYNKKLRDDLGQRGRRVWKEKFTWEKITQQYLNLYENVRK